MERKGLLISSLFMTVFFMSAVALMTRSGVQDAAARSDDGIHTLLPMVVRPLAPPELIPINNSDLDNYFTVMWTSASPSMYVLEESKDPSFNTYQVVYQGYGTNWTAAGRGKVPATYHYRVKARTASGLESDYSIVRSITIRPLFVGLAVLMEGTGYLKLDTYITVGTHVSRNADAITSPNVLRIQNRHWYAPNPENWEEDTWTTFYTFSTGEFRSSSTPGNPDWKWGTPWLVRYDFIFRSGAPAYVDGQPFTVTGPHAGYTAFGQAVSYWELVNQNRFIFWHDGASPWKQYVEPGDAKLRYDAGNTRLLLHRNVKRTFYYQEQRTTYNIQYISNLTGSNSFVGGMLVVTDFDQQENHDESLASEYSAFLQSVPLESLMSAGAVGQ